MLSYQACWCHHHYQWVNLLLSEAIIDHMAQLSRTFLRGCFVQGPVRDQLGLEIGAGWRQSPDW